MDVVPRLKTPKVAEPPKRGAGVKVADLFVAVPELVEKLRDRAAVHSLLESRPALGCLEPIIQNNGECDQKTEAKSCKTARSAGHGAGRTA